MSYPEIKPFEFSRNGHSNRRDDDAEPAVLLLDISPDKRGARLHFAGDENIRMAWVSELVRDTSTIEGMEPMDAFRVGRAACE